MRTFWVLLYTILYIPALGNSIHMEVTNTLLWGPDSLFYYLHYFALLLAPFSIYSGIEIFHLWVEKE